MDLERLLDLVEDAADSRRRRVCDHRLGLLVGEHDDVELRPEALDGLRQHQGVVARRARLRVVVSRDSLDDRTVFSSGTSRDDE